MLCPSVAAHLARAGAGPRYSQENYINSLCFERVSLFFVRLLHPSPPPPDLHPLKGTKSLFVDSVALTPHPSPGGGRPTLGSPPAAVSHVLQSPLRGQGVAGLGYQHSEPRENRSHFFSIRVRTQATKTVCLLSAVCHCTFLMFFVPTNKGKGVTV